MNIQQFARELLLGDWSACMSDDASVWRRQHDWEKMMSDEAVKEYPVISYYADEIWFSEDELIGLTFESAINLFLKKDTTYLRS